MSANTNLVITNQAVFDKVVSEAIQNAIINCKYESQAKRWERAITRAVTEIESNPFLSWDAEKVGLLILSSTSNNVYAANGVCQCKAYLQHQPCWHRAAARIWRVYTESLNNLEKVSSIADIKPSPRFAEQNNAPYLKNSSTKKIEKVGNVRI